MFKMIKQKCVSDIIIDQIKDMVYQGKLKAGDKLPSEAELVEKIGVSRASVREALKALKEMGLIDSKTGEGSFISNNFLNSLAGPMSLMVALNNTDSKKIFEFRKIIELGAIVSAVENSTDEDLIELESILEKMREDNSKSVLGELDREFHGKIVDMSGNIFFKVNMVAIEEILTRFLYDSAIKSKNEDIFNIHNEIFQAIKSKNAKLAKKTMEKHLDEVEKLNFNNKG